MSAALAFAAPPEAADRRVEAASFVLKLRAKGVSDLALLRAMELVPRELFAPRRYLDLSRADIALPLPAGQTMTAPGTVAAMLGALAVRPGDRVLEIGSGSGYVSALLASLGAAVESWEIRPLLGEGAAARLRAVGLAGAVALRLGDGLAASDGGAAPFERILVNGAVTTLGPALLGRLAPGGRLVAAALRPGALPTLVVLSRNADGSLAQSGGGPLRLPALDAPGVVKPARAAETEV